MGMVYKRGFIISDFLFFKNIVEHDTRIKGKLEFNTTKNFVYRMVFFKRRCSTLKILSEILQKKYMNKINYKVEKCGNKIYEKAGWSIIFNQNFIFFKILRDKLNHSFFFKKLKIFLNEKLKPLKDKNLIYIIEKVEFLKKYHQKNVKACILKKITSGVWFLICKKVKKITTYIKKFAIINFKSLFVVRNTIKNSNYLNFKLVKNKIIHTKTLFINKSNKSEKSLTRCNFPNTYFKKIFIELGIGNFIKYYVYDRHYYMKIMKLECLHVIIQNTLQINYGYIFFGFFKFIKSSLRLWSFTKKNIKELYIMFVLKILVTMN